MGSVPLRSQFSPLDCHGSLNILHVGLDLARNGVLPLGISEIYYPRLRSFSFFVSDSKLVSILSLGDDKFQADTILHLIEHCKVLSKWVPD